MKSLVKRYFRSTLPIVLALPMMAAMCDASAIECRTCGLPANEFVIVRVDGESRRSQTDASGCITTVCGAQISTFGGIVVTATPPES